jgi:hypothetical protein
MTINNNKPFPELPNDIDWNGALNAASAGLPDPAVIARLATEFLKDIPQPDKVNDTAKSQVQETTVVQDVDVQKAEAGTKNFISEQQAFPTSAPGSIVAQPQIPSVPGIPGGVSANDFSAEPIFSFINEARSLFNSVPSVSSIPNSDNINIPTETAIRDFTTVIPGNPDLPISEYKKDVSLPQIQGGVLHDYNAGRPKNFGFIDEANSIIKYDKSSGVKLNSYNYDLTSASIPQTTADPRPSACLVR